MLDVVFMESCLWIWGFGGWSVGGVLEVCCECWKNRGILSCVFVSSSFGGVRWDI